MSLFEGDWTIKRGEKKLDVTIVSVRGSADRIEISVKDHPEKRLGSGSTVDLGSIQFHIAFDLGGVNAGDFAGYYSGFVTKLEPDPNPLTRKLEVTGKRRTVDQAGVLADDDWTSNRPVGMT